MLPTKSAPIVTGEFEKQKLIICNYSLWRRSPDLMPAVTNL